MASTQHQMQVARETRADPDSGAVGDHHAAGRRAELWRMADAREPARAPVETVGRSARNPAQERRALRAGEEQIAN